MLAQNNEYIREAAETVYHLSQEEKIRQQCEAREDYYRTQKGIQDMLDTLTSENRELKSEREVLLAEKEALQAELAALRARIGEGGDR